ncbi:MAG: hypothetical protein G01um101419_168 [Parcubacteria group bacterium Gr01-1014_19]|nr:MAG: hypothetical protein G01um101419_168 [Parcubacteria group bacterium Gr01-1014_19]
MYILHPIFADDEIKNFNHNPEGCCIFYISHGVIPPWRRVYACVVIPGEK